VRTVRTGCGGMESGDSCFVEVAEHLLRARGLVRKATTWRLRLPTATYSALLIRERFGISVERCPLLDALLRAQFTNCSCVVVSRDLWFVGEVVLISRVGLPQCVLKLLHPGLGCSYFFNS
jgi:hypothetical protein